MGTWRPLSRTPAANGRYYDSLGSSNGSASESEESGSGYSPRPDSRSYLLNVRPENRTTFCNIISQLTEETQPCFETTLKPRAVSEGCDAKFICMLSGHPEPEVTWYRDDEEMDRYCGLPKYEIFRNGKRHTLQIYKCGEEDAAIYQASARNNKGIVSCSGVLEVGTMTEYKIHQRWFAKLKRKAEAKMREIEQSRKRVKENLDEGDRLRTLSPERIQRKRRFSEETKEGLSPSSMDKEDIIKVHIPDPNSRLQEEVASTIEQPLNLVNGFPCLDKPQGEEITTNGYGLPENIEENGKEFLAYIYETVEVITKKPTSKESYAKKKKKEEEPPSIPKVELKREEPSQGSSPKKGEGISPNPRRSRFGKDVDKAPVEKMEVQLAPPTLNRRFATSTAAPKSGKMMAVKDSKKLKDVVAPTSKTADTAKQGQVPPKGEINFSLKEMYFGDASSFPEEKVPLAHDRKAKAEVQASSVVKQDWSPPPKIAPQGPVKELPKAAPRRSKEQRELSAGRKPPATSARAKADVPGPANVVESQRMQDIKPACNMQQPPVVDKVPEASAPPDTPSPLDFPEQSLKETELSDVVLSASLSPEPITPFGTEGKSPTPGQVEVKSQEADASVGNRMASKDPPEDKAREETLQKLHQLEMEYVALQKAYALLQQQMELGHEAEENKMKISIAADPPDTSGQKEISGTEPKASETQENIEDKGNLVKCPGSPVPVYMETDESIKEEVILVLDTVTPSEQAGVLQNLGSENVSSRKPQDSPVSFMECSSEEGLLVKKDRLVEMEEMDLRVKGTLQSGATPVKTKEVEGGVHQPDGSTLTLKEVSQSSEAERAPVLAMFPSEVEMMEDVKQSEQLAEAKEEKSEGSQARDAPVSEEKSMGSTPETAYMSPLLVEEVASTVIEKSLPLPSEVIPLIPTQAGSQEVSVPKIILDAELPGATSSEILALSDPNQSVATLLRDVKKALESGMANDVEFPSNSSSSSALSPQVMSSPEEYFEVESMLLLSPDEDKCGSQDPVIPKAEDTPLKPKQLFYAVEQDTDVPDVSSPPERRQDEIVQDDTSKEQGKQDHSLVASLKNSLLMLLHMKTADVVEHKLDAKHGIKKGDAQSGFPEEVCSPEGSLSPPTSRKMYESAKDNDSSQSAESMHSSSTSGKMTPASEEDMGQNVESLQTSPTIPRKTMEYSKKDLIPQVESPPLSPATSRKSAKAILEKTFLSKEDLRFSPTTSRKIDAKIGATTDYPRALSVPSIVVGSLPMEKSLGNMLFDSHPDSDRKWKSTENLSLIPSATPQELASGARRKIFLPKNKQLDDAESGSAGSLSPPSKKDSPNVSPGLSRRGNVLLSSQSPPAERRSPGMARRLAMLEVPKLCEETTDKGTALEVSSVQTKDSDVSSKEEVQAVEPRKVNDPYKAPQVIRKIRAELFSDASGNLKLWCQFFNILSDSDITWHKDEVQVAKVKRCSGDEGQVSLAIVQASKKDCGVYQCTIQNDYGTDSTDVLLSAEILSGFISKEDVEVGEEIEMTPMVFAKGLADSGYWGDKFFGRIVMEEAHVGAGFRRKSCRVKVIYGLEPMFESGKTCIIKIRNLITFGTKNESTLVEKNYEITIQECKIQNTTREYCKIFAAESRVVSNFGQLPEILPLNLIYRPANNIPYATIEEDLQGQFEKYCISDRAGKLHMKNTSEIEQKCCTFQHWVYQWTNGNFLVANLEGVGWKLTNIGIATKSKGYQGLKESCYPALLCEFPLVHQCNSYCEMLGLKSLKATEGLQPPSKPKGSKSPSIGRKAGSAQSSPQLQKKGLASPQSARKGGVSPKATRKATETGDAQSTTKNKGNDVSKLAKSQ